VEFNEKNRWLVTRRGAISVACNFANHSRRIPLPVGEYKTLLASEPGVNAVSGGVILRPESVAIFRLE
jgi:hypothetical protein